MRIYFLIVIIASMWSAGQVLGQLRNLIEINLPTLTRFELVIKIFMEILFWSQS